MDLDRIGLSDEFEIEETEVEIETFREVLDRVKTIDDPTNILSAIIEKAGKFLDMIEKECVNGALSARYAEVAATLINTLIQSANTIASVESLWYNDRLKEVRVQQKNKEIEQKDEELNIKRLYYEKKLLTDGVKTTNNNVIMTDRESVIKFLQNKSE